MTSYRTRRVRTRDGDGDDRDNDDEPEHHGTAEGTATFVVELSGESRKTVTVSYKTADGTALDVSGAPVVVEGTAASFVVELTGRAARR